MRKRFGVLLTLAVLAVLVCGLSVAVAAEDTYAVFVGNVGMSDGDYLASGAESVTTTRPASGGYAYYKDGVLTLNGFVYSGEGYVYDYGNDDSGIYYDVTSAIYTNVPLIIKLSGNNTIVNETIGSGIGYGITGDDITIQTTEGTGTLGIDAKDYGIYAYEVTIESGTVDITAENGIFADSVTISSGTVGITAEYDGIYAYSVTISGGDVDITEADYGIDAYDVRIINGIVSIDADESAFNAATSNVTNLYIAEGLIVKVDGCKVTECNYAECDCDTENNKHSNNCIKSSTKVRITAPDGYISPIFVGGVELTNGNYLANNADTVTAVKPAGGYAYYKDGILTLNGFVYEGKGYIYHYYGGEYCTSVIYTDVPLTIDLIGESKIVNTQDNSDGITGHDDITIKGTGSLPVIAEYGIYSYADNVMISGGTVTIESDAVGIGADVVTIAGGTVTIETDGGGIGVYEDATISGGTVTIDAMDYGINTVGTFRFTGGSLTITCETLIEAGEGIEIDDSALPDGVAIEQYEDGFCILVSKSGTSIRIEPGAATTAYFGKVIRSMQTISFPGVPELDGLWRAFGSTINLTKITPEPRDGYTFTGWYADEACTKPITKIVVTGNMQLFAGWEEIAAEEEENGTAEAEQ